MRIAVDAMGGDHAPRVNVDGAVAAFREFGIATLLVGRADELTRLLSDTGYQGTEIEVVNASGYKLALVFLPMTVLMIVSSVLAGRWTAAVGPRWSITIGCLLFAIGLFLTDGYLSPHPDYGPLIVALALVGIGIGTTVVPVTSSVLNAVPAERSAWPRRPPTPAGRSARSPAWRSSARWCTPSCTPA